LLDRIRKYLAEDDERPIRFLILDFQRVSGLDSSAVYGFIKSKQFADERDIQLVFTDVEGELYRQMDIGGLFEAKPVVHRFPDLDHGLEWCEDQLLQEQGIVESAQPGSLPERLVAAGMAPANAERLIQYLERLEVVAGEILAQQGEKADALYFVENGKLSIYLELENGEQVRLQTLGKRLIVGELGLYLDEQRTASIIADQPSVVYCLSSAKLDLLKQQDPELAATLHEFVASLLAERLADTTRLLSTLYP
jgi:SulP family sulfate permease